MVSHTHTHTHTHTQEKKKIKNKEKTRSRIYATKAITHIDNTDDIALLTNRPTPAESLAAEHTVLNKS